MAAGDVPGALAAAIADPGRIEVVDAAGVAGLEPWLRAQEVVGTGLVLDDPRPLAGIPLALAVSGPDGRVVAAEGPDASNALRHLLERIDARLVGHEVKPLLTMRFAESADADPTPIAFDTQIAAYLVNAALRAQKIADVVGERLDLVMPPAAAGLSPVAIAGLEALGSLAVKASLEEALRADGVDRLFAEIELPLIPILARMEAAGIALDRDALRRSRSSSRPRSRGSSARSSTPSATSSRSAAPSSWARSCSSSWACPRAARRRPATRPTRACSRSCAASTRSSSRSSSGGSSPSCARPTWRRCRR